MDSLMWARMHGGTTHFPIALIAASLLFDGAAFAVRREPYTRDLHAAGFYALVLGALVCFPAVLSGLLISRWETFGAGMLLQHHLYLWPSFGLMIGLAVWRLMMRDRATRRALGIYLAFCLLTAILLMMSGYWGGEMLVKAGG